MRDEDERNVDRTRVGERQTIEDLTGGRIRKTPREARSQGAEGSPQASEPQDTGTRRMEMTDRPNTGRQEEGHERLAYRSGGETRE